ncbi:MAG: outer membrane lipoprotein-sorting protein [Candidatus Caldarchaeum sp.]
MSFLDWLWSWLLYFLQWRISTEPLYDKNDKLLKRFIANEVKVIQNIPTRTKSTAENLITKRKSTFELIDPKYDTRLPDELFDPKNLGK